MSRTRIWSFTAVVAFALALHLAMLSTRIAQSGEDTVRAKLASASSALRAQMELLDLRNNPRAAASSTDLIDALKPPADPTMPVPKPDDKALRAAAAAATPEPDLLIVATGDGAAVSRRGKPAQLVDDVKGLPLVRAMLDGAAGAPAFVEVEGQLLRLQGAKIPGSVGAVVAGIVIDDRVAAQLRSRIDADVTFLRGGLVVASSVAETGRRGQLAAWVKNASPGFGTLELMLPIVGRALDGKLPRGATHYAVRGALVPFDGGVMAAVTVPAAPHLRWLGRYQAIYAVFFVLFLVFGLVWGLLPGKKQPAQRVSAPEQVPVPVPVVSERVEAAASKAAASLVGAGEGVDRPPKVTAKADLPWTSETPKQGMPQPEHGAAGATGGGAELWGDPLSTPKASFMLEPPVPEDKPAPAAPVLEAAQEPVAGGPAKLEALDPELAPAAPPAAVEGASPTPFSFAGLIDEAKASKEPAPAEPVQPQPVQDTPDVTSPGTPNPTLLAHARAEGSAPPWPGDEPTRIEPVSAALLDKLRERDPGEAAAVGQIPEDPAAGLSGWAGQAPDTSEAEPAARADEQAARVAADAAAEAAAAEASAAGAAAAGAPAGEAAAAEGSATEPHAAGAAAAAAAATYAADAAATDAADAASAEAAAQARSAEAPPTANVTLQDFSFVRPAELDADEAHFQETFQKFLEARAETGETATVSYDKFAAKLRKNRDDLMVKHSAKSVRFTVYVKDGKAAIKASAVK